MEQERIKYPPRQEQSPAGNRTQQQKDAEE